MKLNKFFRICSSDIKLKMLIHLYSCTQNDCDVQSFVDLLQQKQSNISKHFMELRSFGVVEWQKVKQKVFYELSPQFKTKYNDYLKLMAQDTTYAKYLCVCLTGVEPVKKQTCTNSCC